LFPRSAQGDQVEDHARSTRPGSVLPVVHPDRTAPGGQEQLLPGVGVHGDLDLLLPAAGARLHRVRTGRHGQLDVPAAGLDPHRFRLRGGQLDVARAALRGQLPTAQVAPGDLPAPGPHDDVALDVRQPDVPRTGAHLHATADVLEL